MDFAEKVRKFLEKLQALPEIKKKIILWTIVAVLAVVMGFFWVRGTINKFSKIGESMGTINIPALDTSEMPEMPSLDSLNNISPSDENISVRPELENNQNLAPDAQDK